MNYFRHHIALILQKELSKLGIRMDILSIIKEISIPPSIELGHFAYPCFALAKKLKKAPSLIAMDLKNNIPDNIHIESIENIGSYVNFFVYPRSIGQKVISQIITGDYFNTKLASNTPKSMIEFSQPNTHKELHVGHMRNLCLGDSLIKLHKYCGYEIISSTFPGDVGTHVAKCLWYLKYHNKDTPPLNNKGAWLGKMYSKGHLKLESEQNTKEKKKNKEQLSEILTQLENEKGEFYDLWKETRQWSIDLMEKVYQWANVSFDKWYWESEVDVPSVQLITEYYNQGYFSKSEGAIGIDLSEYDLGYCVLIKSDGHGLYATKDIELARRKFEDYKIEKNIYIVDERQAHHFAQVFKVLEIMGFKNAKNCYHLGYNYVELPDGPMSSRKGNIIPIMDLINQMESKVRIQLLERYKEVWSKKEIKNIASTIAKGAIKYGMLKIDVNKKIIFNMEDWLDLNGDSGPYLQYVYTRIKSLCRKQKYDESLRINWEDLNELEEKKLMVQLVDFNSVVLNSCQNYKPNILCNYLFNLAKSYNSFYNACSISNAETEEIKNARLALSKSVSVIMRNGLELLGISVPDKM